MVLHTVGQPLISQDDLYNDNHSHTIEPDSWSTPPDGLQWTLNNLQSTKYFALDSLDSEDAISRMLRWTIHLLEGRTDRVSGGRKPLGRRSRLHRKRGTEII